MKTCNGCVFHFGDYPIKKNDQGNHGVCDFCTRNKFRRHKVKDRYEKAELDNILASSGLNMRKKPSKNKRGLHGWKCFRDCGWKQDNQFPEPEFTEKACGCCWDFECPKCGGPVETVNRENRERK